MKYFVLPIILLLSISKNSTLFAKCKIPQLGEDQVTSFRREAISKFKERWTIQLNGPIGTYSVKATVYPPHQKKFLGLNRSAKTYSDHMILFPTINGEGLLENKVAKYFARHDYWVVIPTIDEINFKYDQQTTCQMDQMFRRVQQSAVTLFDKLVSISPNGRKFLIGASQGGIRTITSASIIPDLEAMWANVAGGDFPSVYARSNVDQIEEFRHRHMASLNLTNSDQYESYLRESLTFDPAQTCLKRNGRLAMVVALEDSSVPTYNQKFLEDACSPEQVRYLKSGHVRGVIDLWLKRRTVREFLENI